MGGNDGGDGWRRSGEVHGPQSVVMNLNSLSQRLGIPTVTLTGHMAALSTAERREGDERASKDELHISCLHKNND